MVQRNQEKRTMVMKQRTFAIGLVVLILAGPSGCYLENPDAKKDAGDAGESGIESDSFSDSASTADTNTGNDTAVDDTESDTFGGAGSSSDTATGTGASPTGDTRPGAAETDEKPDWGTDTATESITGGLDSTDAGSDTETFAESDVGTENQTGIPTEIATETETATETEVPRCDPNAPFGAPIVVSGVSSETADDFPRLTWDGLTMYFQWGGQDYLRIYQAVRLNGEAVFDTPELLEAPVGSDSYISAHNPVLSFDGQRLYVDSLDISFYEKGATGFDSRTPLNGINSAADDYMPVVSRDELTILWALERTDGGAKGGADIWLAIRESTSMDFNLPRPITELNSPEDEAPSWISEDRCELYMTRFNPDSETVDVFVARRPR